MKYAQIQVLPEIPPGGLTAGIDWGSADHAVCVVDTAGQVRARFTVAHDRAGIGKLIAGLRAAGVSEAAIERSDGVLVRGAAGGGADGGGDHLPADEEPAVPVWVSWRQG